MTTSAKIEALHADESLSHAERQWHVARTKSLAHAEHPSLPTSWSDGDIKINVSLVEHDHTRNVLRVHLAAFRDGELLNLNLPYEYHNPPLAVRVGESVVENVPQAFREMVTQTVRSQAG